MNRLEMHAVKDTKNKLQKKIPGIPEGHIYASEKRKRRANYF